MKKLLKFLFWTAPKWFVILSVTMVLALKCVPVTKTVMMLKRTMEYRDDSSFRVNQQWLPLEGNSTTVAKITIAAEDPCFFRHHGFGDEDQTRLLSRAKCGGPDVRGAITLSQKTAQAVFMTGCSTLLDEGVRDWFSFLIEHLWGKKRIAEVYMNVAEYAPGLYGAEAASRHYYRRSAKEIGIDRMAALSLCPGNPAVLTPGIVNSRFQGERYAVVCQEKLMAFPAW